MNKEVIIDGVDVSECEHQTYEKCAINFEEWNGEIIRYLDCSNYPNCYFKQLKRKEQECEKLKQWKKDAENLFKTQTDNADKIISRYKQVLDEIEKITKNDMKFKYNDKKFTITQILNIINKAKEK